MRIRNHGEKIILRGFRVMLFRMVPKPEEKEALEPTWEYDEEEENE